MVALYKPVENDRLAAEHRLVTEFVEAAITKLGTNHYGDLDLKLVPEGQRLLDGDAEENRRCVIAAVIQAEHWNRRYRKAIEQGTTEIERASASANGLPVLTEYSTRRNYTTDIARSLIRRALPFDGADLRLLVDWCCAPANLCAFDYPLGGIVRALERYAGKQPIDAELAQACAKFARQLRGAYDKDAKKLGTKVEQLCGVAVAEDETDEGAKLPAPAPAIAGDLTILSALKQGLAMLAEEESASITSEGPDLFSMRADSSVQKEHRLLSEVLTEVVEARSYSGFELSDLASGKRLLKIDRSGAARMLLAAAERHVSAMRAGLGNYSDATLWQGRYALARVASQLLERGAEFDHHQLFDLILYFATGAPTKRLAATESIHFLIGEAEKHAQDKPLTDGERFVLHLFRNQIVSGPPFGTPSDEIRRLNALIRDGACFYLVPREAWTDALNSDVSACSVNLRTAWANVLKHCSTATTARPSAKWLKEATKLLETVGYDKVTASIEQWFPLVSRGQTQSSVGRCFGDARGSSDTIHDENANILRGLLWCVPLLPQHDSLPRLVAGVALSAYKKVPGVGPRAVKVGNGAVYALSALGTKEAVGQLAMLKVRVRFGTAQKEIEKAFDAAATALSLPRDQIEELGVPSYGMEEVGLLVEQLGDYRAELRVNGSDAALQWFDAKGKSLKSVPAKVKNEHKEELKELQQSLKDVQAMLPAQRDRIDSLFLLQKSWPVTEWRERYLEHPLVGTIARRLIWCVDGISAVYLDGNLTDGGGKIVNCGEAAEITLWHPAGRTADEITDWRQRLEELKIVQPFKQAYREIYLLTDAERNTRTYSNRFAAHVIKQHQFNALCAARGWKNKLRLMVDDSYPPASKELPEWGLRAEFWIEGIGDDYGTDTNDAGTYLRLSTDQVRFYQLHAAINYAHAGGGGYESVAGGPGDGNINAPLPLEQVPELVLSEIMRDVDLFVGVASVGNDPTWQDGGPEGRYRTYWQSYSFGELSGTATTRKQVLERLIPRLKIASQCSFSDRFLIVRGKRRTYKIHLGSGNILMEPNDQYLCIVPDSRARKRDDEVYLPFEGDSTLSIIISKALLLADDLKISDSTITRQIDMK
jgi:hypothetical protein